MDEARFKLYYDILKMLKEKDQGSYEDAIITLLIHYEGLLLPEQHKKVREAMLYYYKISQEREKKLKEITDEVKSERPAYEIGDV